MTSRILKLYLPVDCITTDTLVVIKEITKTRLLPSKNCSVVTVRFETGQSIVKLNTFATKISSELKVNLFSIFQNPYECTLTYIR